MTTTFTTRRSGQARVENQDPISELLDLSWNNHQTLRNFLRDNGSSLDSEEVRALNEHIESQLIAISHIRRVISEIPCDTALFGGATRQEIADLLVAQNGPDTNRFLMGICKIINDLGAINSVIFSGQLPESQAETETEADPLGIEDYFQRVMNASATSEVPVQFAGAQAWDSPQEPSPAEHAEVLSQEEIRSRNEALDAGLNKLGHSIYSCVRDTLSAFGLDEAYEYEQFDLFSAVFDGPLLNRLETGLREVNRIHVFDFRSIDLVDDETSDVVCLPGEYGIRVGYKAKMVSFSLSGETFTFGPFFVNLHLNISSLREGSDSVKYYLEVKLANDGDVPPGWGEINCHPHVNREGTLCFGNLGEELENCLNNGDYYSFMVGVSQLLSSYNPEGAYVLLT